MPYELPEIVKDLHELAEFDWESFLKNECLGRSRHCRSRSWPVRLRIEYSNRVPGEPMGRKNRGGGGVAALDSIGLTFSGDGTIADIVPGRLATRRASGQA